MKTGICLVDASTYQRKTESGQTQSCCRTSGCQGTSMQATSWTGCSKVCLLDWNLEFMSDHFLFQPTRGILEKRTQLTVCVKMFDHCSYKLTQTVLERAVEWLSLNDKRTETHILRQMSSQRGHCQDDGLQAQ